MGSRLRRVVTEYKCDWCDYTEEVDQLDGHKVSVTTLDGWQLLHELELWNGQAHPPKSELICSLCAMKYRTALMTARDAARKGRAHA